VRRNLKQIDFEEGFFGSKQDREIAAANAQAEKLAAAKGSEVGFAESDTTPQKSANKAATSAEGVAGQSSGKVVTTFPPVQTKVFHILNHIVFLLLLGCYGFGYA